MLNSVGRLARWIANKGSARLMEATGSCGEDEDPGQDPDDDLKDRFPSQVEIAGDAGIGRFAGSRNGRPGAAAKAEAEFRRLFPDAGPAPKLV